LKVAFFTDTFLPQLNGVSITMQKLFEYLDQRSDCDYKVFAPGPGTDTSNKVYRSLSIKFILYPECRVSIPNYSFISKALDDFKPDMIHISTPFSMGLCGLFYARKRGIPLTTVYHTNFNDYLKYYRLKFIGSLLWKYLTWFHNNCDINYCPSIYTKEQLLLGGIKNLKLWVRGVDTDFFSPKHRGASPGVYHMNEKTIFLYVGRIAAEKNFEVLTTAIDLINRDHYDKVHFFIVGDGPMLDKVKKWDPGNVTCTGYLTGSSLARAYADADIFIFPSTSETFGNVVLEAMASGLPVVGAFAAGVRDNLIDGVNGVSCQPDDPVDLAAGAIKLLKDKNLMKTLGDQACSYALEKSLETGFQHLVESWEVLISKQASIIKVTDPQKIMESQELLS
jgi:glycosyltransferase involved in cell wall biosynthesis